MSDRLKELREKRGKIVTEMRTLTEKVTTEKRDMTGEEVAQHDKLFAEQETLAGQIKAEERQLELNRELAARTDPTDEERRRLEAQQQRDRIANDNRLPENARRSAVAQLGVEYRAGWSAEQDVRAMRAFNGWLRNGASVRSLLTSAGDGGEDLKALAKLQEFRDLQAGSNTDGGYLVAPMEFVAQLIIFVNNLVFVRRKATTMRVNTGASLGAPSLDTDIDDSDWTNELATGNADAGMKFGRRELFPHPLAKRIKISKRLLRIAAMPVEQIVMQRMAYKFAITQEKGFLLGTGQNQPLGIFTASNDGISTGRDVSTGNTTTAITFDGLMEAKYSLKQPYWDRAEWMFHRDAVKQIVKIKDGDGQYIWLPSVLNSQPDRLLGSPLSISEYVPNTFTTGLYVGIFGDLSYYWIADALDMQVQRLVELYAETNQDGFIGRMETDGMPVLEEAFARVKLG